MKVIPNTVTAILLVALTACTQPGETTQVGAATGGVLGAGFGAVVGSAAGSTGEGALVGALAGVAAGGAVGNALEAQEVNMQRQDEAIERQQNIIASQQAEIQELRRLGQDGITYREGVTFNAGNSGQTMREQNLVNPESQARGSIKWSGNTAKADATNTYSSSTTRTLDSDECVKAQGEVTKADTKDDVSDKLFHFRRALRLCPENASFHNGLGQLYLSLNRKTDAEFEFNEALRLDPNFQPARDNLIKVK